MRPESDQGPESDMVRAQQRQNLEILKLLVIGLLLLFGLIYLAGGARAILLDEAALSVYRKGRPNIPVRISGLRARWTGAGMLAIGSGFLLSLAMVPKAVASHFNRTGILSLPIGHIALLIAVAMLLTAGLVCFVVGLFV